MSNSNEQAVNQVLLDLLRGKVIAEGGSYTSEARCLRRMVASTFGVELDYSIILDFVEECDRSTFDRKLPEHTASCYRCATLAEKLSKACEARGVAYDMDIAMQTVCKQYRHGLLDQFESEFCTFVQAVVDTGGKYVIGTPE